MLKPFNFFCNGSRLKQFFRDHYPEASTYKGRPTSGNVSAGNFHATSTKRLTKSILANLEARFADVSKDVVAVTRIANFKQWPLYSKKDDVTGEDTKIYPIQSFYFAKYKVNKEGPNILFILLLSHYISTLEGCSNMQKLTVSGWNWNG